MAVNDLRKNPTMAHLLDALDEGKDIGHYGRLVFAIVARHFMDADEVVDHLQKDEDFSEADARALVQQVQDKGYNPPNRDTIRGYQEQQDFPILPEGHADDPDVGNLYQDLDFPDEVYENISAYRQQKAQS